MLPILVEGTRLHLGVLVALLIAVGAWLADGRARPCSASRSGSSGQAPARGPLMPASAGKRLIWLALLLSGGARRPRRHRSRSPGPIGQLMPAISPGYGFTAIIVAFLGRLHPVGIVLGGLVLALSYIGGENAQIDARPAATR